MDTITINNRTIGAGHPTLVIAELGVNHNGDFDTALRMIDAAHQAGADAAKFQLYYPDRTISRHTPQAKYAARAGMTESHLEMTRRLMLKDEEYAELAQYCRKVGIEFMCTGFDETAIDTLVQIGVRALKIPSGEIDNLAYLRHAASYHLPMIVSTGMSDLWEVGRAVDAIESEGNHQIVLLHCVSNYPADARDCNLQVMDTMRRAFGYPVGFSDHTKGGAVAVGAVALGACVIEKHFTLDKNMPGPDHQASVTPDELVTYILGIRKIEIALGDGIKRMRRSEINTREVARKSVVANSAIAEGEALTFDNLTVKRPGTGIEPSALPFLVGRVARRDIAEDELITPEALV